jgi:mannose-6-phosphate isomerase-like protein (cupin superfamily)
MEEKPPPAALPLPLRAHPAPVAGQVWHLGQIMRSGVPFATLIGTYADEPRPPELPPALRNLSLHYWHLQAGDRDTQRPHKEDELYFVLAGQGALTVAGEHRALGPGDVVFVPRGVNHTFSGFDGAEGLHLLILFAPEFSG